VLIKVVGTDLQKWDDGAWWATVARAAVANAGEAGRDVSGVVEYQYAGLMLDESRFDDAIRALDQTLAIWTATRAAEDPLLVRVMLTRAIAIRGRGKVVDALLAFQRLLPRAEELLGPSHPFVAVVREQTADTLAQLQRFPEAIAEYRIAITLTERTQPPSAHTAGLHSSLAEVLARVGKSEDSLSEYDAALATLDKLAPRSAKVGLVHSGIGVVLATEGRYREALLEIRTGLEVVEKALGPDAVEAAQVHHDLAMVLQWHGRLDESLAELAKSRAIFIKVLGADHPSVADIRVSVAQILAAKDQIPEALAELGPAVAVFERALGADAPYTAWLHVSVACLQLQLHRDTDRALATLDRALAELEKGDDHDHLADAQFEAAKAIVGRDHPRALELARRAHRFFAELPANRGTTEQLTNIERWIAANRRS
jgi:tetratricopeptide (TPR) repeat protein